MIGPAAGLCGAGAGAVPAAGRDLPYGAGHVHKRSGGDVGERVSITVHASHLIISVSHTTKYAPIERLAIIRMNCFSLCVEQQSLLPSGVYESLIF